MTRRRAAIAVFLGWALGTAMFSAALIFSLCKRCS